MGSELDNFNAQDQEPKAKDYKDLSWGGEDLTNAGVCIVCDVTFTAPPNVPPILCPNCKLKIKNSIGLQ